MDVFLRTEVEALLKDLWSGTEMDLALAKAGLDIRRRPADEDEGPEVEDLTKFGHKLLADMLYELGEAGLIVDVKETYDGPTFEAVPWADLKEWIDAWPGDAE